MNILLIMADQMGSGILGAAGHSVVLTPNLDRLAAGGALFENCYCNSPLCVPSRASMVTGRLPTRIGSFDNGCELPASIPTFLHALRLAGFRTAVAGKLHFVGPDQLHGFEERLTPDIYPAGLDWTPDWGRGLSGNPGTSVRRLALSGPGDHDPQWVYDEQVESAALAWLADIPNDQRPFFLCVSFSQPHCPFVAPPRQWAFYEGLEIAPPAAIPDNPVHEFNRWINLHHGLDAYQPDEETVRRSRRAYYAMVTCIDERVGRLLDALQRSGRNDETVVLFTSDHGEMLGEHGMWYKRTFYDPAAKVPLIIRNPGCPGRPGLRPTQVVSLVDLFPTLLDLAEIKTGLEPFGDLDGSSFATAVCGRLDGWKDTAICEYCGEGVIQPMRLIRRGNHKYVYVPGCEPLLFDLRADPLEQHNLAGQQEVRKIEASLREELLADWDGEAAQVATIVRQSQKERRAIAAALRTGHRQAWDWPPGPMFT